MTIELPKNITVGPWTILVKRDDSALYRLGSDESGRRVLAASDSGRGYIALREDKDLSLDQLLVDLVHEVIHTILDAAGVDGPTHPEQFIDIVALGIIPLLRANPDLVDAITGVEAPSDSGG